MFRLVVIVMDTHQIITPVRYLWIKRK